MAYAFLQDNLTTVTSSTPSAALTGVGVGNTLIIANFVGSAVSNVTCSTTNSDTVVPIFNISVGGFTQIWAFYVIAAVGGSTTANATITGGNSSKMYIGEYSGLASFIGGNGANQNGPGTGANIIATGNVNATSQPAMIWGIAVDASGTEIPAAGTSPISFTPRQGAAVLRTEDARLLVTGNAQATFGNTSNHVYQTVVGIFAESLTAATAPQCGRTIYILP